MAKSVKKSGVAPKAAAKPRKSADNNPGENKIAEKKSAARWFIRLAAGVGGPMSIVHLTGR